MITPSQRQILEAVLEALPEKKSTPLDIGNLTREARAEFMNHLIGYNSALQDVRAIINEFLEPEESNFKKMEKLINSGASQLDIEREKVRQIKESK